MTVPSTRGASTAIWAMAGIGVLILFLYQLWR